MSKSIIHHQNQFWLL